MVLGLLGESQPRLDLRQAALALDIDERHSEHDARRGLTPRGADPFRRRHRLLRRRAGAREVGGDRALRGQLGKHQGPGVAGRVVGQQRGGALEVEVVDSGRGAGRPVAPGGGITGMRERAAALGGRFDAGDAPGGGFRVWASLPVSPR